MCIITITIYNDLVKKRVRVENADRRTIKTALRSDTEYG